jgi:hypothetical protein
MSGLIRDLKIVLWWCARRLQFVNWEHTPFIQGGPVNNDMLDQLDVFSPERISRISSPREEGTKALPISFSELLAVGDMYLYLNLWLTVKLNPSVRLCTQVVSC